MADALVLNYNDYINTSDCAIRLSSCSTICRVLVVDNHSTDDSLAKLKSIESDKIIVVSTEKNGGYGYGNNYGIRLLKAKYNSEYILLCNPDTFIEDEVIAELEIFLKKNDNYALAAPYMLDAKMKKQPNTAFHIITKKDYILSLSILFSHLGEKFRYKEIINTRQPYLDVDCLSGSLFMMNVDDMVKFGMYDENIFLYGEEYSIGMKLKQSPKKLALLPNLSFVHKHSLSISKSFNSIKKRKIQMKSRLYIIKEYYKAGPVAYSIAKVISLFSLVELFMIEIVKRIKRC